MESRYDCPHDALKEANEGEGKRNFYQLH
jgi:hypothetical protein